jgi:hypothetical protein
VDRTPRRAIPHDGGFALIGDTDRGDVARFGAGLPHGGTDRRNRRGPDFFRIVLDLSRTRIDLPELLLRRRDRLERGVEHDRARRGRALIDCEEIIRQGAWPGSARSTERHDSVARPIRRGVNRRSLSHCPAHRS